MKRMKRAVVGVLLLLLLLLPVLCGCTAIVRERAMADLSQVVIEAGVSSPAADGYASDSQLVTLYFLSTDAQRMIPVTRRMVLEDGMCRAEGALRALLSGALPDGDAAWPIDEGGASAVTLEISDGIATVNLPARYRALEPQVLYAVRLAVTNTLTAFSEIAYVNVLVGGREEGVDLAATMPAGTLSRVEDMDVQLRYSRMSDLRTDGEGFTLPVTLYYPASTGKYLLSVVRSVSFASASPVEYLYTLLNALGRGASNEMIMQNFPAPLDYIEEMPELVRTEDGAYRAIELRFSGELDEALAACGLTRGVYLAMLTHTLMGIVPGVEGMQILIGGMQVNGLTREQTPFGEPVSFRQTLASREDFEGYLGAPVTLFAQAQEEGRLRAVVRLLSQESQNQPREQLLALMALGREEGMFTLPDTLTAADILAVRVETDAVVLNLSAAFGRALAALPAAQARVSVYAMVNTLTQTRSQRKVIFFFEGEQLGTLDGGLDLRGSLLRNPGMVVK